MPALKMLIAVAVLLVARAVRAEDTPAPLSGEQTLSHMSLPDGFKATLFAGEPDVVQPIAMAFDDRGRLWVIECFSYPGWRTSKDRVVILEDRDGDGRFDERKVFWDEGPNLSGINVGFGGVWLCSTPNLIFVPDADHDDKPDGPPQVAVDGFDIRASHNVSNSLTWGPDGWLYGCNGILSNSLLGTPGTSDNDRVKINCGVWRYHPTRKVVEAVAHGTTNPWGLDFDDYGQMFITNCVIAHLWHVIPGAHFQRMFGQDYNPHTYDLLETTADHLHWGGGHWTEARGGAKHHSAGGGHAHSGAMVYLGDNLPGYRNHVFTCNIHGHRLNQDALEQQGSGYVAHHGEDMMLVDDPWFRGLTVTYGPDGGVFVADWTDTGECHNYQVVDQSNGRIYKITAGNVEPWKGDLAAQSDEQLVQLQLHANDWMVRHARRLLQERHAAGKLDTATRGRLLEMLAGNADPTRQLRALWALHVTGGLNEQQLTQLLASPSEYLRGWAIHLELEDGQASPDMVRRLGTLAKSEPTAWVRLALASGLQRLPVANRWEIAAALTQHSEDVDDANLPLMLWYGIEPLVPADTKRGLELALSSRVPLVSKYIARRAGEDAEGLALVVDALGRTDNSVLQVALLDGAHEALHGHRHVAMPAAWNGTYRRLSPSADAEVRHGAMSLAVIFNDRGVIAELLKLVANPKATTADRAWAIEHLLDARDPDLVKPLESLVGTEGLSGPAIRGLAVFDSDATPKVLLSAYGHLNEADQRDAVNTLCARPQWALALLKAVGSGELPRTAISSEQVRQLNGFGNAEVSAELERAWGVVRESTADKLALLQSYRDRLPADRLRSADRSHGRAIFARVCSNCHTLFDAGGRVGPNLTGSQRANMDYVLTNVLDPNAVVPREYQMVIIQTTDGRVLNGIVKQEDDLTLGLQTTNEIVTLSKDEIEVRKATSTSMMPEGMLVPLGDDELRDLMAYLASPEQVPLPPGIGEAK